MAPINVVLFKYFLTEYKGIPSRDFIQILLHNVVGSFIKPMSLKIKIC
jgi:hypothetical protein